MCYMEQNSTFLNPITHKRQYRFIAQLSSPMVFLQAIIRYDRAPSRTSYNRYHNSGHMDIVATAGTVPPVTVRYRHICVGNGPSLKRISVAMRAPKPSYLYTLYHAPRITHHAPMSKQTYIIDGYNVIHKVPEWVELLDIELARAREVLCAYCAEWMSTRNDAERFIVVFDGDSSVSPFSNDSYRGIRIIYTATGETADSRIIALVEDMARPRDAVVVSDDGEVMRKCGMAGADIISVRKFVGTIRHRNDTASSRGPSSGGDDNELTPSQRNQITNDLRREWGIE